MALNIVQIVKKNLGYATVDEKPAPKYCALCKSELAARTKMKYNVYTGNAYVERTEVECPNQNRKREHSAFAKSKLGDWWISLYD